MLLLVQHLHDGIFRILGYFSPLLHADDGTMILAKVPGPFVKATFEELGENVDRSQRLAVSHRLQSVNHLLHRPPHHKSSAEFTGRFLIPVDNRQVD